MLRDYTSTRFLFTARRGQAGKFMPNSMVVKNATYSHIHRIMIGWLVHPESGNSGLFVLLALLASRYPHKKCSVWVTGPRL